MKKKLFALALAFCTLFTSLTGCSSDNARENNTDKPTLTSDYTSVDINIGCMKGPTSIGMIKLLSDSDNFHQIQAFPGTFPLPMPDYNSK